MTVTRPFPAYSGDAAPVFVCYSHTDAAVVFEHITFLHERGVPIWYDEGIEAGREWRAEIAEALDRSRRVLYFQSAASVESRHCSRELGYAVDRDTPVLRIVLDDSALPPALSLALQAEQAIDTRLHQPTNVRQKLLLALDVDPKPEQQAAPNQRRGWRLGTAMAAVAALIVVVYTLLPPARPPLPPEPGAEQQAEAVRRLIADGDDEAGFAILNQLRLAGNAPADLEAHLEQIDWGEPLRIDTQPSGARMARRHLEGGEWQVIGTTPLEDVRVPSTQKVWRFDKDGYEPREMHLAILARRYGPWRLYPRGAQSEVVQVPRQPLNAALANYIIDVGIDVVVPEFEIDRLETTNREFAEFVAAGGYAEPKYWAGLEFNVDGVPVTREAALALMVDTSGRPGPAGWEFGTYPPGNGEHPVTGISWYEAMAYARFRDKSLPTIFHWVAAVTPIAAAVQVRYSNFGSAGPRDVGSSMPGHAGLRDPFGNAREWLHNATGTGSRWIQGGAWDDPPYFGLEPFALAPMDRNERNGVRLARYASAPEFEAPRVQGYTTLKRRTPVGDEAYAVIREQFAASDAPLEPRLEVTDSSEWWRREVVSLRTGRGDERFLVHVFLPPAGNAPYQGVVLFPWSVSFMWERESISNLRPQPIGFLPRAGRAVIHPVFTGTYERFKLPLAQLTGEQRSEWLSAWYNELARTLDYLATRGDIDVRRLAYFGDSVGGNGATPLLALEPRLKVAIFSAGGLGSLGSVPLPSMADPVNFLPRMTQPTLMLNGRYDFIFPLDSQELMFSLLGTPAAEKRHVVYDAGHGEYEQREFRRQVVDWYDTYLGPVAR